MVTAEPPPLDPNIQYALGYLLQALSGQSAPQVVSQEQVVRKPRKRTLPKRLSRDEAEALLRVPDIRKSPTRLRDRCVLELMYRAGLRSGEVRALAPRDVDTVNGTVRITAGKSGDRTAWFDTEVVGPLIEEWKRERDRLGLSGSPYLFCTIHRKRYKNRKTGKTLTSEPGKMISKDQLGTTIRRFARRAGIEGWDVPRRVTPHVLRHTFATELIEENVNVRKVQKRLGHANLNTTELYTHLVDADLMREAQERAHPLGDHFNSE